MLIHNMVRYLCVHPKKSALNQQIIYLFKVYDKKNNMLKHSWISTIQMLI